MRASHVRVERRDHDRRAALPRQREDLVRRHARVRGDQQRDAELERAPLGVGSIADHHHVPRPDRRRRRPDRHGAHPDRVRRSPGPLRPPARPRARGRSAPTVVAASPRLEASRDSRMYLRARARIVMTPGEHAVVVHDRHQIEVVVRHRQSHVPDRLAVVRHAERSRASRRSPAASRGAGTRASARRCARAPSASERSGRPDAPARTRCPGRAGASARRTRSPRRSSPCPDCGGP